MNTRPGADLLASATLAKSANLGFWHLIPEMPFRPSSALDMLGHLQGVIHVYPEVANRALNFPMTQQQLHRAEVLRLAIDQRRLRAAQGVRAVLRGIGSGQGNPAFDHTGILAGRQVRGTGLAAGKQKICTRQVALFDPGQQGRAGWFGDLEPHGQAGLVLHDAGPGEDMVAMGDVTHVQADEITAPQFAVDGQVEEREVPRFAGHAQTGPHGPDLPELQGRFLPHQLALVPGGMWRGGGR